MILLALVIECLYQLRFLHCGDHGIRSAMDLVTCLWEPARPTPVKPGAARTGSEYAVAL